MIIYRIFYLKKILVELKKKKKRNKEKEGRERNEVASYSNLQFPNKRFPGRSSDPITQSSTSTITPPDLPPNPLSHPRTRPRGTSPLSLFLSVSVFLWYPPPAMDALLYSPTSMAKRPCPSQNPRPQPPLNQMDHTDHLLEAFLALTDSPSSIDLSFDRLLDSRASSDVDQTLLINRALRLGSALLGAANRSARKRASKHNSLAWALPPDLTIKVCDPLPQFRNAPFCFLWLRAISIAAAKCAFVRLILK